MGGIVKSVFGDPDAPVQAAEVQQRGSEKGVAEQCRQFDITEEQLEPFRQAELRALG